MFFANKVILNVIARSRIALIKLVWYLKVLLNQLRLVSRKKERVDCLMLDFSWKVFSMTGSVDTYLIMKEIERDTTQSTEEYTEKLDEIDTPTN
jgi:hypothetical protein